MPNDNTDNGGGDAQPLSSQLDGKHPKPDDQDAQSKMPSTAGAQQRSAIKESGPRGARATVAAWFTIPPPLKRIFDQFPLITYAQNAPPIQGLRREENALHVFTSREDAILGRPSFNPSCLKWQTYLKFADVPFRTVSSTNHASPSGSLPFLLVAPQARNTAVAASSPSPPLPEVLHGTKLKRWIQQQDSVKASGGVEDVRYEAYASLLDNAIRKAWLYQLYLSPANEAVVRRLYIEPCSSNALVQLAIASQLRAAAETEIVKGSPQSSQKSRIDEAELMRDAGEALAALSALLGEAEWFFSSSGKSQDGVERHDGPRLFDASLFAYSQLILDPSTDEAKSVMRWEDNPLKALLQRHANLVRHQERLAELYY